MEILKDIWSPGHLELFEDVHAMGHHLHWKLEQVKKLQGLKDPQLYAVLLPNPIPNDAEDRERLLELQNEFSSYTLRSRRFNFVNHQFFYSLKTLLKFQDDEISFILETCHQYGTHHEALSRIVACF
ncbi:hypothetical protein HMI55_007306 [Coelomomyces lativittatus]|nr:hypothetical protein HMI55_007306 [Coelomomyces lativittatus]